MDIDALHHEMKLSFGSQAKALEAMATDLRETRDDVRLINGRLRLEERWTARMQGAIAVVAALGVGNVIALLT